MDVITAFLNGLLLEDIYMTIPVGVPLPPNVSKSSLVCKLLKALYGLKQSSRAWYYHLHEFLIDNGFLTTNADSNIYMKRTTSDFIIIAIYVDDYILLSNSLQAIFNLKSLLSQAFDMIDDGELQSHIGIHISRNRPDSSVMLNQTTYLTSILERFQMDESHSVNTPLEAGYKPSKEQCPSTLEEKEVTKDIPYSQAIGSLIHAQVFTRPDIAYSVNSLSQYLSNPGLLHWQDFIRVLHYIKGTLMQNIVYQRSSTGHI
jgi:hypothetical protein